MNPRLRYGIIAALAALAAASIIAYLATGMYPFTRFEDPELAETNESQELSNLFGETGVTDDQPERVESVNAIGLLPSGPGLASISVATVTGPAAVGIAAVWWLGRRSDRRSRQAAPAPAGGAPETVGSNEHPAGESAREPAGESAREDA